MKKLKLEYLSQREYLIKMENVIKNAYPQFLESARGATLAEKICNGFIKSFQVYSKKPSESSKVAFDSFSCIYDDILWSSVAISDLYVVRGSVLSNGIPFLACKNNIGELFYVLYDGKKFRGCKSGLPNFTDTSEIKLEEYEKDILSQVDLGLNPTKTINIKTQLIPNNNCKPSKKLDGFVTDKTEFNKQCISYFSRLLKELDPAMMCVDALELRLQDKDYIKSNSINNILKNLVFLLLNPFKDNYTTNLIMSGIDMSLPADDIEIDKGITLGGVPYLEVKTRSLLSSWVYMYLYLDNAKNFNLYIPRRGNWINPQNNYIYGLGFPLGTLDWLKNDFNNIALPDTVDVIDMPEEDLENMIDVALVGDSNIEMEKLDSHIPLPVSRACLEEFELSFPGSSVSKVKKSVSSKTAQQVQQPVVKVSPTSLKGLNLPKLSYIYDSLSFFSKVNMDELDDLKKQIKDEIKLKIKEVNKKIIKNNYIGNCYKFDDGRSIMYYKILDYNSKNARFKSEFYEKSSSSIKKYESERDLDVDENTLEPSIFNSLTNTFDKLTKLPDSSVIDEINKALKI